MDVSGRQRVVILDQGRPVEITCSKCGERKVLDEFGLRKMPDGSIRNQPRCRACRSSRELDGRAPQLKLPMHRVDKVGMSVPHKLIVTCLERRQRNQGETALDRLAHEARVKYEDALAFAHRVQRDGAGKLIRGRKGRRSRIKWLTPLTEYVASARLS